MAKKTFRKMLALNIKSIFGTHDSLYRLFKKVMYFFLWIVKKVHTLTPSNLSYYLFQPKDSSFPGYITFVTKKGIAGLAFSNEGSPPVCIELYIGETLINRTFATQKVRAPTKYAGLHCGFFLPMKEVWSHVPRSQSIKVLADGRPLTYRAGLQNERPLPNRGVNIIKNSDIEELINSGHLINKFGRIQKPRHESKAWSDKAFGNYERINKIFEQEFDKPLFAFYGVMLGFAREGGVLAHDLDLDLAYFSEKQSPEEVRKEFFEITKKLIQLDIPVQPFTYKLQFNHSGLSVTPCWISDGCFSSTFGYVGDGFTVQRDDIFPLAGVQHDGHQLWLPRNPQAVAAYLYGKGWKYPDPGWKWLSEYKNRPSIHQARLTEKDIRELLKQSEKNGEKN